MRTRLFFLWVRAFFGLTPADKEDVLLEPFFLLGYYFGMSWETYYHFPVAYKRWLVKRIEKEIKQAQQAQSDIPTKAPHHNTPDVRQLSGKTKWHAPNAKGQRFT